MDAPALLALLVALPLWLDGKGYPIARPAKAAATIVAAALETTAPLQFAVWLDALAAGESGYRTNAAGDCPHMKPGDRACTRELGAASCGAWQTPCARTPSDALGQARLALKILQQSLDTCPAHPLWAYASGSCRSSKAALRYERETELLAHPMTEAP